MHDMTTPARLFNGWSIPPPGVYAIDPEHTFVEFRAQHVVIGHVRGRFDATTGTITIADDPLLSSVSVTIDTTSISTHSARRDEDLRSPRFFHVDKFPSMSYRSTAIEAELDGGWTVDGTLTIRDVTLAVPLAARFTGIVDDQWGNRRLGIHAHARVSRRAFGLLTDLERESGGVVFGKDVHLTIDAEVLRRP
jgi:polyisoprenoid-binding protein YceI